MMVWVDWSKAKSVQFLLPWKCLLGLRLEHQCARLKTVVGSNSVRCWVFFPFPSCLFITKCRMIQWQLSCFAPSRPRFDSQRWWNFSVKKFDFAEIYWQRHCLERVDNAKSLIVDLTYLVLASGKLVQRKIEWLEKNFFKVFFVFSQFSRWLIF